MKKLHKEEVAFNLRDEVAFLEQIRLESSTLQVEEITTKPDPERQRPHKDSQ